MKVCVYFQDPCLIPLPYTSTIIHALCHDVAWACLWVNALGCIDDGRMNGTREHEEHLKVRFHSKEELEPLLEPQLLPEIFDFMT